LCTEASIQGVARDLRAEIELVSGGLPTPLDFSAALAAGDEVIGGCIDLVVSVPEDAAGSEVILRRVNVAGCDVPLDKATVRVIVGFNHTPAPAGRVYAAAEAGDIPALTRALDDGCSTQETDDEVRNVCRPHSLEILAFLAALIGPVFAWCGSLTHVG
jgi:hypothetical protein